MGFGGARKCLKLEKVGNVGNVEVQEPTRLAVPVNEMDALARKWTGERPVRLAVPVSEMDAWTEAETGDRPAVGAAGWYHVKM